MLKVSSLIHFCYVVDVVSTIVKIKLYFLAIGFDRDNFLRILDKRKI